MTVRSFSLRIVTVLLVSALPLVAQVNTEAMRHETLHEGVQNQIDVNLTYQSGNTDFLKFNFGWRLDFLSDPFYTFLVASYQRGSNADDLFLHNGFLHFRLVYALDSTYKVETFAQKEFNDFIRLKDRNLIGAGVRISLLNHPPEEDGALSLHIGLGGMFENEVENSAQELRTNLVRSTNYLSFQWRMKRNFSIGAIGYYQVALTDASDFRVLGDATLRFGLNEILSFTAGLHLRFDNEPPPDVKKHDLELRNGIAVRF